MMHPLLLWLVIPCLVHLCTCTVNKSKRNRRRSFLFLGSNGSAIIFMRLWNINAIAAALTLVMGQRFLQTQKIMSAGLVAGISVLMTCFYIYKITTGGNHIPPKAE